MRSQARIGIVGEVSVALWRGLCSMREPGMVWHLLWPALAAAVLWTVGIVYSWTALVGYLLVQVSDSWVGGWFGGSEAGAATLLVVLKIALALAVLPLVYVTAALLVSVFAMPMMLDRLARREYRDLEMRRGGNNAGSLVNTLFAGLLFMVGLLVSLPLWLIPGAGMLISIGLTAWLNQKAFSYDALMLHADREELRALPRDRRMPMLVLGVAGAMLAYVPFLNLLAPAFCGLSFAHLMLESLRKERSGLPEGAGRAFPAHP